MDLNKAIDGVDKLTNTLGNQIDKNTESKQDRRHRIDLTSPFKLPHLIRPISTLYTGIIWGASIIWALAIATTLIVTDGMKEASSAILAPDSIIMYVLGATTTMYGTHIGFYFNSRKNEKINANKARAAIEIEEIKLKQQIKTGRIEARRDRRDRNKNK